MSPRDKELGSIREDGFRKRLFRLLKDNPKLEADENMEKKEVKGKKAKEEEARENEA